ncbi:MAG TPA: hypothetical protein VHA06_00460 [Candidatus Angelobacter sp.]|nr:hypothetical protein [Candidatus Angelobacter sp.]
MQCTKLASLLHHTEDPRQDVGRMYDASIIVCLCTDCHHPGQGDDGRDDVKYVPTVQ